ncbi:enoyl-CoA hydratase-related protein [Parasphingorhabdus sp.]|uniref:enoyl-CoA hydratase/isomerase family protein n=1 Tax=Parasphingorhabdus sp. TaxID=2709688 RepID=UPI0032EEA72D
MLQNGYQTDLRDGVLTLTLDRPEAANAVPSEATEALTLLFRTVAKDRSVRAVLIRGNGSNFSAGGDIKAFARSLKQDVETRRADFRIRLNRASDLVQSYVTLPVPVVAACQGGVAGAGMLFALGADVVLVDETTAFLFAHQRLGLTPDAGVSLLLPRAVGARHAAALVLTAAKLNGAEAVRLGLANKIVAADQLQQEAEDVVRRIARAPAAVTIRAKRLLQPNNRDNVQQLAAERDAIVACVGEDDFAEGVQAFLDKRAPIFPSTV